MPMRNRKVPETDGPISPVAWCSVELVVDGAAERP